MDSLARVQMLETFIEQNPTDPFPRYSLALECMNNLGDSVRAAKLFDELTVSSPDYVATYLMYGNLLAGSLGEVGKAKQIYKRGIEVAQAAGDGHAASEIQAALADLPDSE